MIRKQIAFTVVTAFFLASCGKPPIACLEQAGGNTVGSVQKFDATCSGVVDKVEWDLGDGTKSNAVIVNHTYTTAGTYSVVLTVTNNGLSNEESTEFTIF